MKCRVVKKENDLIDASKMPDGSIGIIESYSEHPGYVGLVVKAAGSYLIAVAGGKGNYWSNRAAMMTCRVRILTPPFTLEITED